MPSMHAPCGAATYAVHACAAYQWGILGSRWSSAYSYRRGKLLLLLPLSMVVLIEEAYSYRRGKLLLLLLPLSNTLVRATCCNQLCLRNAVGSPVSLV